MAINQHRAVTQKAGTFKIGAGTINNNSSATVTVSGNGMHWFRIECPAANTGPIKFQNATTNIAQYLEIAPGGSLDVYGAGENWMLRNDSGAAQSYRFVGFNR